MSNFLRKASKVLGAVATVARFIPGLQIVSVIAGIGATLAGIGAELTAKPPSRPGTENEFIIDTQAPLSYIIGRTRVGGAVVHRRSYTEVDNNPWQTFIIALSVAGPIEGIESYSMNGSPVTFTGGAYGGGNAVGHYHDFMYMGAQLGQSPEATQIVGNAPGFPDWTPAHKLSGFAALSWTLKFDSDGKKYGSGEPEPGALVEGVKVYDPRLDSTYPGGSGPCRALIETTYVYSENPALHGLTWAIGRVANGKRVCGVGLPISQTIVASFVDAANTHDANGFKVGGLLNASVGKYNNLRLILEAGAAEPIDLGGMMACFHERPRVSLATIGPDDLADSSIILPGMRSKRERINTIIPRYRSEDHNWQYIPADAVASSTAIAEDGESRTREYEYTLCQDLNQVAKLAAYSISLGREIDGVEIPLKIKWIGYQPGDCVTINLPDEGVNNVKVIITRRSIDPQSGTVRVVCRTETDDKHAFALGQTGTAPPSATLVSGAVSDAVVNANVATVLGNTIIPGTGLTSTVDTGTGTVTIDGTGPESTEAVQDIVGAMIVGAGGTYDDGAGTITLPAGGGGGVSGAATITVPSALRGAIEWTQTVTATGVTPVKRILLTPAPYDDVDENSGDLIDFAAYSATAGTDEITITASFTSPTSGMVKFNWSAI